MSDDLIERLEKAEGLCFHERRQLEAEMFGRFGKIDEKRCEEWCRMDGRTDLTRERYIAAWAPNYLDSIDAALTLVPEGWWLVGMGEGRSPIVYANDLHEPSGSFWAKVQHVKGGRMKIAQARTLPLALCIAALKARKEQQP